MLIKVNHKRDDPYNKNIYELEAPFLEEEDFESIFDSMDVLETGAVPKSYLTHALKQVGVKDADKVLKARYSKLIDDEEHINKASFIFVLS